MIKFSVTYLCVKLAKHKHQQVILTAVVRFRCALSTVLDKPEYLKEKKKRTINHLANKITIYVKRKRKYKTEGYFHTSLPF